MSKTRPCPTCTKAILPLASTCQHCGSKLTSTTQELLLEDLAELSGILSPEEITILKERFDLNDGEV